MDKNSCNILCLSTKNQISSIKNDSEESFENCCDYHFSYHLAQKWDCRATLMPISLYFQHYQVSCLDIAVADK